MPRNLEATIRDLPRKIQRNILRRYRPKGRVKGAIGGFSEKYGEHESIKATFARTAGISRRCEAEAYLVR